MEEEDNAAWVAETGKRLREKMDEREREFAQAAIETKKAKERSAEFYRNMDREQHSRYHTDLARIIGAVKQVTRTLGLDEFCWLFLTKDTWSAWKAESTASWQRKYRHDPQAPLQFTRIFHETWTDKPATTNMDGPLRVYAHDLREWALKLGVETVDPSERVGRFEPGTLQVPFSERSVPFRNYMESVPDDLFGPVHDAERHLGFRVPVAPPQDGDKME